MASGNPEFVAKLPWTGPTPDPTPPRDGNSVIRISGTVQANQGKAYAAGFVPVNRDTGHDRFVPADASGTPRPVEAVAKLDMVESDGEGLFELKARASWWKGVEGVLVVLLFSTDLGDGTFPNYLRKLLDAQRSMDPSASVDLQALPVDLRALLNAHALSSALRPLSGAGPAWPPDVASAMNHALEELLRGNPVSKLKQAVVRIRRP